MPMDKDTQELLLEIRDRVIRVETKIEGYNGLREKVDKAYNLSANNKEDVDDMKDNQKWLWRTTLGGILAAVIAFIFGGKA
jgi:hypothetical protein